MSIGKEDKNEDMGNPSAEIGGNVDSSSLIKLKMLLKGGPIHPGEGRGVNNKRTVSITLAKYQLVFKLIRYNWMIEIFLTDCYISY